MRKLLVVLLVCVMSIIFIINHSSAEVIIFDDIPLTGPSTFAAAGPAQHLIISTGIGNVLFDGGVILTNTANLPANQTSLYGTADFADTTLTNPLMITFPSNISNFFLDVYNGENFNVDYKVYDNIGNSAIFTLIPNLSSGQTLVGFAAAGSIIKVEAISGLPSFDFFIDNIHFNEALPPDLNPVPEPATMLLLGSGLVGLVGMGRKKLFKRP